MVQTTPRLLVRNLIAIAGLGLAAAPALSQDALGDGRSLDANLSTRGRYNTARPSFAQELQFRNAIVTGNAPGGLSFRGDLGYRAAGEFTGELGSDSLYAFRRDSLYSGLAGMGIRGTDALQYQFSLTTGARPPQNLMGDLTYTRDDQFQSSAAYAGAQIPRTTLNADPNFVDPRGMNLYRPSAQEAELADALTGSLRSASQYTSTNTLSPVLLNTFELGVDRQPFGLTASVLTGVTTVPMADPTQRPGQPAQPGQARPGQTGQPGQPGQNAQPQQPMSAYQQVVERLRERAAAQAERTENPANAEMQAVLDRLNALRAGLMGVTPPPGPGQAQPNQPAQPGATQPGVPQPGQTQPGQPGQTQPAPGAPTAPIDTGPRQVTPQPIAPAAPGTDAAPRTAPPGMQSEGARLIGGPAGVEQAVQNDPARLFLDPETLELIRAAETPLPNFVDPDAANRDLYSEHMRAGERLISSERYFDAEERFARALAIRPGDPIAQVGRAHAQLGAGLVLSASVNLRSLFILNPEMIGARYAGRLLPAPDRINALIENLRERSGLRPVTGRGTEDVGSRVAAAFLIAYLGFQNNQPDAVREGLAAVEQMGSAEDARFAHVLAQVWLADAAPGGQAPQDGP